MNRDLLQIYLDDHAAATKGAIELAHRAYKSNEDNDYGRAMRRFLDDFEAYREAMVAVLHGLKMEPSASKDAAAWLMEKVGRLKLNGRITGYSPLSRLVEIEGMLLAAQGARQLFRSLTEVDTGGNGALFADVDVEALIARTDNQIVRLEALHQEAASAALDREQAAAH